jgi:hypothetical protein
LRVVSVALALLLSACATDVPTASSAIPADAGLCPRLDAFARSVPPGEYRSVSLSGEGLIGTQTCTHGGAESNPGGKFLCEWWASNSAREFFGTNYNQVVRCLVADEISISQSAYISEQEFHLASIPHIDSRIAAEIVLDPPKEMESRTGGRVLIVTFRRSAT